MYTPPTNSPNKVARAYADTGPCHARLNTLLMHIFDAGSGEMRHRYAVQEWKYQLLPEQPQF